MIEAARAALGGKAAVAVGAAGAARGRRAGREPRSRSNLPVLATPLVGRDAELAEVVALLEQPAARLVTLTGLGGTGKSRLALEAATTRAGGRTRRRTSSTSSPVQSPELVGSAIADVLGVREAPNRPLAAVIAERLADRTTLIVLDNFEQRARRVRRSSASCSTRRRA